MSQTQEGYLLIADITGYTMYLSQSELDHAQETLTTLLKLLVELQGITPDERGKLEEAMRLESVLKLENEPPIV